MERSVVSRYYKEFRHAASRLYVHELPTGLCAIGLDADHPAVASGAAVVRVSVPGAPAAAGPPMAAKKLIGKRKRGARETEAGAPLCEVHTADGAVHVVPSPFPARVLELNAALEADPSLCVRTDGCVREFEGYLVTVEQSQPNRPGGRPSDVCEPRGQE